jgi:3-dehydroquinate synthase
MTKTQNRLSFSTMPLREIHVELGDRGYPIRIGSGLIAEAGKHIRAALPGARCAVVTDDNVAALHIDALCHGLGGGELMRAEAIVLPPGESTKCFAQLGPLCEKLLGAGVERGDCVIAFGGGVIGDLAGFAASILRRGVRLVQIPTTLLAQVDSSVGGKTGINTAQGKNLIGTFHQPSLVLADTQVLHTLPARQLRAGYAEVAKYGLLGDAAFFGWLETNLDAVLGEDEEARAIAIETSCRAKAAIVAADEREAGARALLNLGHTFGHALEAWAGYSDHLLHGEAIAVGMVLAFKLSERMGLCAPGTHERVAAHLRSAGLPTRIRHVARPHAAPPMPATLIELMAQDKKVQAGRSAFILARGIGEAFVSRDVSAAELAAFLAEECRSHDA